MEGAVASRLGRWAPDRTLWGRAFAWSLCCILRHNGVSRGAYLQPGV